MTTPKPKSPTTPAEAAHTETEHTQAQHTQAPRTPAARTEEDAPRSGTDTDRTDVGAEFEELSRTRDDAEDRARELLAAEVLQSARNGSHDERARQLVLAVRRDLLAELRDQEQARARRQLADAADSSEDAVAGLVQGVTTIVRSLVPSVLVRPEEAIETTFALADQGLRISRRLALTVTQSVRSLVTAA